MTRSADQEIWIHDNDDQGRPSGVRGPFAVRFQYLHHPGVVEYLRRLRHPDVSHLLQQQGLPDQNQEVVHQ